MLFDRIKNLSGEFLIKVLHITETFYTTQAEALLLTQKKSEAFRLLGSCSRLSVSDVTSWELGVLALFGVGVPDGVDGPPKGDLQSGTECEGDGV